MLQACRSFRKRRVRSGAARRVSRRRTMKGWQYQSPFLNAMPKRMRDEGWTRAACGSSSQSPSSVVTSGGCPLVDDERTSLRERVALNVSTAGTLYKLGTIVSSVSLRRTPPRKNAGATRRKTYFPPSKKKLGRRETHSSVDASSKTSCSSSTGESGGSHHRLWCVLPGSAFLVAESHCTNLQEETEN